MARQFFQGFCLTIFVALLIGCSDSSDSHRKDKTPVKGSAITAAESAALQTLDIHLEARNSLDPDLIASANNYPNMRLVLGIEQVFDTYESYKEFEDLIVMPFFEASEWDHSEWDEIEIIQSSEDKVHLAVIFSRVNGEGEKYLRALQFYIVTNQGGHWGIKIRSPVRDADLLSETDKPIESEEAALDLLNRYVEARNERDSGSLAALNHYPQLLLDGVELKIFDTPEDYISYEENTVIHGLDYAEWDHSELDIFEVIQSSPTKVHLTYTCEHLDVVGERTHIEEGLWVVTKVDDRWGILGRSMF